MIEISKVELLVLKKLVLVNHALGQTLAGEAGREQRSLTKVLNEITVRADVDHHSADSSWGNR